MFPREYRAKSSKDAASSNIRRHIVSMAGKAPTKEVEGESFLDKLTRCQSAKELKKSSCHHKLDEINSIDKNNNNCNNNNTYNINDSNNNTNSNIHTHNNKNNSDINELPYYKKFGEKNASPYPILSKRKKDCITIHFTSVNKKSDAESNHETNNDSNSTVRKQNQHIQRPEKKAGRLAFPKPPESALDRPSSIRNRIASSKQPRKISDDDYAGAITLGNNYCSPRKPLVRPKTTLAARSNMAPPQQPRNYGTNQEATLAPLTHPHAYSNYYNNDDNQTRFNYPNNEDGTAMNNKENNFRDINNNNSNVNARSNQQNCDGIISVVCEIKGKAVPTPPQGHLTSPRKTSNAFSASLAAFKRRLKISAKRFNNPAGFHGDPVTREEDYIIDVDRADRRVSQRATQKEYLMPIPNYGSTSRIRRAIAGIPTAHLASRTAINQHLKQVQGQIQGQTQVDLKDNQDVLCQGCEFDQDPSSPCKGGNNGQNLTGKVNNLDNVDNANNENNDHDHDNGNNNNYTATNCKNLYRRINDDCDFLSRQVQFRPALPSVTNAKTYVLETDQTSMIKSTATEPIPLTVHNLRLHDSVLSMQIRRARRMVRYNRILGKIEGAQQQGSDAVDGNFAGFDYAISEERVHHWLQNVPEFEEIPDESEANKVELQVLQSCSAGMESELQKAHNAILVV